jgi:glycosyltransferase involved in cell wall biosynthesis
LRLAVVSPFVDRRHGTERALAELLDRLAHSYHCQVHLYAERVEDLALDNPGAPRAGEGAIFWHRVPAIAGPHLIKFVAWMLLNGLVRWWDRRFRGCVFDLVLSPGINCLNPDVVIVHVLFHRIRELSGRESANARPPTGFFKRLHRRVYYGLLTRLERAVYSDRRVLLAGVSLRTADLVGQYFQRGDVHVVPNGVDTREFSVSARLAGRREARDRRGFRDTDFVLLLIGNDWSVKGVPAVLAAMAAVPGLPSRLLVAGNDAPEAFREMAKRLGILDRCVWEAPRADVIDLYAAADLYVSPSREDSFGLPVAEAMACGLPVITSNFAGVSGLIRKHVDGFVLHDPEDTSSLVELLEQLHHDAALRNRIGLAAATAAQDWTWDRNAAEVWKLLSIAVAKSR